MPGCLTPSQLAVTSDLYSSTENTSSKLNVRILLYLLFLRREVNNLQKSYHKKGKIFKIPILQKFKYV